MGAAASAFDEPSRERAREIIEETLECFSKHFMRGYKMALVQKCKMDAGHTGGGGGGGGRGRAKSFVVQADGDYQLVPPPPATDIITIGQLTKRGDVKKNWKKRWFVALNEANNFDIKYYDLPQAPKKEDFKLDEKEGKLICPKKGLKGTMKLAGYGYEPMVGQENIEDDELGLVISGNEHQRPWYVKAESKADLESWTPVFQRACKEALPPVDDDILVHQAFLHAYRETRWDMWLWGSWYIWGAEEDMLGGLVMDVLMKRLLRELIDAVPAGAARSMTIAAIKKAVGQMVRAAAGTAWKTSLGAIHSVSGTLQEVASKSLGPLFEQEPKMTTKVSEAINEAIQPHISKLANENAKKIFDAVFGPIGDIFVGGVRGFAVVMKEKMASGVPPEEMLGDARWHIWHYGHDEGMLERGGVWATRDKFNDSPAVDALAAILSGKTARHMAFDCVRTVAILCEMAVFDVGQQLEVGVGVGPAVQMTTAKLVNDAQLSLETFCLELLGSCIAAPLSEALKPLLKPLVDPIADLVPDALKDFIDVHRMASIIVDDVTATALKGIVCPSLGGQRTAIEAASKQ